MWKRFTHYGDADGPRHAECIVVVWAQYSGNTVNRKYIVPIQSVVYVSHESIQWLGYEHIYFFQLWLDWTLFISVCVAKRILARKQRYVVLCSERATNRKKKTIIIWERKQISHNLNLQKRFMKFTFTPDETTVECLDDRNEREMNVFVICGKRTKYYKKSNRNNNKNNHKI